MWSRAPWIVWPWKGGHVMIMGGNFLGWVWVLIIGLGKSLGRIHVMAQFHRSRKWRGEGWKVEDIIPDNCFSSCGQLFLVGQE